MSIHPASPPPVPDGEDLVTWLMVPHQPWLDRCLSPQVAVGVVLGLGSEGPSDVLKALRIAVHVYVVCQRLCTRVHILGA